MMIHRALAVSALIIAVVPIAVAAQPSPSATRGQQRNYPKPNARFTKAIPTQPATPTPTAFPTATFTQCQPTATVEKKTASEEAHRWPPPWWDPFWSNWGVVLVTAAAAWIAIRTLKSIRKQVGLAEHSLMLDQRPWIVATGVVHVGFLNGDIPEGFPIPFRVEFKNTGPTPALSVVIKTRCYISEWEHRWPTEDDYPSGTLEHHIGAIGPGLVHNQWMIFNEVTLTKSAIKALFEAGTKRLLICGLITYRDRIGEETHVTRFCIEHMGSREFCVSGPYNDCT